MGRFFSRGLSGSGLAGLILGSVVFAQAVPSKSVVSPATTPSSSTPIVIESENVEAVDPASLLPDLPALRPAKASLIGGTIQRVDRVRDQLTVQIFGGGQR